LGADAAFRVRNYPQQELVAFRSNVNPLNLLGGIPAGAPDHGFRRNPTMFGNQPDAFAVVLVTVAQLNQHAPDWTFLNNNAFSRIPAFFNPNVEPGVNLEVFTISGQVGGDGRLTLINPTPFDWELRVDGHRGPTIGYVTGGMQTVTLNVETVPPGSYFFPVARVFNRTLNTFRTIYPRNSEGQPWFTFLELQPGDQRNINLNDARNILNTNGATLGVAWMAITNNHPHSDIRIFRGATPIVDSMGWGAVRSGTTRNLYVPMPPIGANNFAEYTDISVYYVGIGGFRAPLTTPDGSTNIRFRRDYRYVVNVSGDHMVPGTFQAIIDVDNARMIRIEELLY